MAQVDSSRISVCVFAKPPRAGQSKTRLAATLGDGGAARLAEAFLRDTWAKVKAIGWARPVLATTDEHDEIWASIGCERVWPQGAGDLGQRMERALCRALSMHEAAIVIGTDCPLLSESELDLAAMALRAHDVVIGPSEDGGFYLLGVRHCPAGLLDGVAWGTDHAYGQTIDRVQAAGLTIGVLPMLFDVDRLEDVSRLRGLVEVLRRTAPETAKALEEVALRGDQT
jgi:uncharacterized protein